MNMCMLIPSFFRAYNVATTFDYCRMTTLIELQLYAKSSLLETALVTVFEKQIFRKIGFLTHLFLRRL